MNAQWDSWIQQATNKIGSSGLPPEAKERAMSMAREEASRAMMSPQPVPSTQIRGVKHPEIIGPGFSNVKDYGGGAKKWGSKLGSNWVYGSRGPQLKSQTAPENLFNP